VQVANSGELLWLLGDGDDMMKFRMARRTRWWRRLRRLCPEEGEEFGWSCTSGSELRVSVEELDLLRNKINHERQMVCKEEEKRMGRRRRVGVHRRRRNRPRELADLRRFGDKFRRSGDVSREEGKGG
jgi:hypothetical protein